MAAANLTAGRPWSPKSEIRYRDTLEVAAGTVLYPGSAVAWNTTAGATKGYLVKYDQTAANAGLIFLGRYNPTINVASTADNTAGANGAIKAEIEFFKPHYLVWWDNDTVHTAAAADRGSPAYGESDHEAGNVAGSLSRVGTFYAIGTAGDGSGGMVAVDITGQV